MGDDVERFVGTEPRGRAACQLIGSQVKPFSPVIPESVHVPALGKGQQERAVRARRNATGADITNRCTSVGLEPQPRKCTGGELRHVEPHTHRPRSGELAQRTAQPPGNDHDVAAPPSLLSAGAETHGQPEQTAVTCIAEQITKGRLVGLGTVSQNRPELIGTGLLDP